jgi:hypothetical protein
MVEIGSVCDAQDVSQESVGSGAALPSRQVPLVWPGNLWELSAQFVNEFLVQLDPDGVTIYLTVGIVTPPPILGSDEEKRAKAEQITSVPIHPVARFAVPREKFEKLFEAFDTLPSAEQLLEIIKRGGAE